MGSPAGPVLKGLSLESHVECFFRHTSWSNGHAFNIDVMMRKTTFLLFIGLLMVINFILYIFTHPLPLLQG